ncbi:hypothetical protein ABDK00_001510 [Niabella insulamsoli]|uniref:hypothetical protein n=1 Tax=Niabella insulamsoli TaxID=3144874 RepID=UPI0031FCE7BA
MKKQFLVVRYPKNAQMRVLPENNAVVDNYESAVGLINGMLVPEGIPMLMAGPEKSIKVVLSNEVIELIILKRSA